MPGGKEHCDHQGYRARVPDSSRAGLCTRNKVTVTQKYVLARIYFTHSGKLRSLLITCPALANAQRAAGDEPKTFFLSYRDLGLVIVCVLPSPSLFQILAPSYTKTGDCKSGHSGRWEICTAKILPEFFLCSTLAHLAHLGQN